MSTVNQESLSKNTNIKPAYSRSETKADITHSIATAMNESEYAKRVAKTSRLKKARLAQEADLIPVPMKKAKPKLVAKKQNA